MILQAPILALLLISAVSVVTLAWAAWFGLKVVRAWDLASGARRQLELERRTHLVSTALVFLMIAQVIALIMFVYNADRMAGMFVGAMCAVGTLNVNAFGFPALFAKIALFFAASLWLILDAVDRRCRTYPLIRFKYGAVLAIAPLVLAGAGLELAYFLNLKADVITSCCSKLFTPEKTGLAADLSGLGEKEALGLLTAALAITGLAGLRYLATRRGTGLYAISSAVLFVVALTAIVSVVALYVYEHPHHHCPFCLMQAEYGYFGYALYLPLFFATALGLAPGLLDLLRKNPDLSGILPAVSRRLVVLSLALYTLFAVVVLWAIFRSGLILFP